MASILCYLMNKIPHAFTFTASYISSNQKFKYTLVGVHTHTIFESIENDSEVDLLNNNVFPIKILMGSKKQVFDDTDTFEQACRKSVFPNISQQLKQ